jgi:NmrA-like family
MKKYVITGSVGRISKPVIEGLVNAGHSVSVVTSNTGRVKEIESLGASGLVGSLTDSTFLTHAFKNADTVYTMIPPVKQTTDWRASQLEIATSYAHAVRANEFMHVVNLTSVGAHEPSGAGPASSLHDFEQLLNQIPGLHVRHIMCALFYHNFMGQIALIKQAGIMGANYGVAEKNFLVHPINIAEAVLEELLKLYFTGSTVHYVIRESVRDKR